MQVQFQGGCSRSSCFLTEGCNIDWALSQNFFLSFNKALPPKPDSVQIVYSTAGRLNA